MFTMNRLPVNYCNSNIFVRGFTSSQHFEYMGIVIFNLQSAHLQEKWVARCFDFRFVPLNFHR